MISVSEAEQIITKNIYPAKPVRQRLADCVDFVLLENIRADRDIPAFNKVLMDGIAINSSALEHRDPLLRLQGTQAAGQNPLKLKSRDFCIEIMTGAVLPTGCDIVIPLEQIQNKGDVFRVRPEFVPVKLQHVQMQGSDRKKGDVVLSAGEILTPAKIAVAASIGKSFLKVGARPSVAIISTGDELVDVNKKPKAFQVRKSNSYALQAALNKFGYRKNKIFHVQDNKIDLRRQLSVILKQFDVLVLSGGVSMGKFDFVPEVLQSLNVKVLFHKVSQKPGKPFWFGMSPSYRAVFALPGNPVSTQVCFYRYVLPYLARSSGRNKIERKYVPLSRDFIVKTDFVFFLPVILDIDAHGLPQAKPCPLSHSGDFAGLSKSDGFVELEAGKGQFSCGSVVPFFSW